MPESSARRTFGPVVLLGIAGSGFAAVAGHKAVLTVPESTLTTAGVLARSAEDRSIEAPLAGALALVALAAWGVLLVTRGIVRRVVAVLALAAAAGIGVVLLLSAFVQDDTATRELAIRIGLNPAQADVERTPWVWIGLVCALVAVVAAGLAVRLVPEWPEMGTRYDAPTGASGADHAASAAPDVPPAERSNLALWKSLDEGSDPTDE